MKMQDDSNEQLLRIVLREGSVSSTKPCVITQEVFEDALIELVMRARSGDSELQDLQVIEGYLRPDSSYLHNFRDWLDYMLPVYAIGRSLKANRTIARVTWEGPLLSDNLAFNVPSHLFAVIPYSSVLDGLHERANDIPVRNYLQRKKVGLE
jgi:hypothetical protein